MTNQTSGMKGSWGMALFALPFAAVGLGMLLLGVLPMLYDGWRMQQWQPVSATLVSAQLHTHQGKKSGATYSVVAHYRYEVAGRPYESQRVAINDTADNAGSFQVQLGRRLEHAHSSGQPVQAWVHPSNPQEAVLDRSLRWEMLGFKMVFVLLFGGAGSVLMAVACHARKAEAHSTQAPPGQPWLGRAEWAGNRIRSDKRGEVWLIWFVAAFWNLITLPGAIGAMPKVLRGGGGPWLVIGLVLLLSCALGLLVWAVRATLDVRRHGEMWLEMDPFPGAIGGHVGASLALDMAYRPGLRFKAALLCLRHERYRSAGGKWQSREHPVWQSKGAAQVQPHAQPQGQGIRLSMRFSVPPDLPESSDGTDASQRHSWRLEVESIPPAPRFARRFEVPVYATSTQSTWLAHDAASHPQAQVERDARLGEVSGMQPIPGGVRLHQPCGRLWRHKLHGLVVGAVFLGAGLGAGTLGAPAVLTVVFALVGGGMLAWGIYALCNSLRVQLDGNGLHTERRLLGLMLRQHKVPAIDIAGLGLQESYSTQSGGRHTMLYRVQAVLRDGQRITLADSLRGHDAAQQMLDALLAATGYAQKSESESY